MKTFLNVILTSFLMTAPAYAVQNIVKTCSGKIQHANSQQPPGTYKIQFISNDGEMSAKIYSSQRSARFPSPFWFYNHEQEKTVKTKIIDGPVREGLFDEGTDISTPNDMEDAVMYYLDNQNRYLPRPLKIDLTKIRWARIYTLMEDGESYPQMAVMDTKDANGKALGSYFFTTVYGGVLSECREK